MNFLKFLISINSLNIDGYDIFEKCEHNSKIHKQSKLQVFRAISFLKRIYFIRSTCYRKPLKGY